MPKQIVATAKYIRQSPRKIQAMVMQIKELPLDEALDVLSMSIKKAARPLKKVLESAVANAVNNHGCSRDSLKIKELFVTPAPTARRLNYRARGRADIIRKRSAHIRVVLEGEE